jgi:hypothetical protein
MTILRIKLKKINDEQKAQRIRHELETLERIRKMSCEEFERDELVALEADLEQVNQRLWDVEDEIRDHERRGDFGPSFVALARNVYLMNDRRFSLKSAINKLVGSNIIEEKSYAKYD